ncbi:hypothetical protein PanWU01x14_156470, partial [Parasponia andersonii]
NSSKGTSHIKVGHSFTLTGAHLKKAMSTLLIWFDTVSIFRITLHKNIRPIHYIYVVGIFLMRDHIHWEERWTYLLIFLYHIARKSFSTTRFQLWSTSGSQESTNDHA